ncbi:MAG: tyrosine-type recombinase/integrase [Candidatus Methylomirabilota bacterium]|jgi:integrase
MALFKKRGKWYIDYRYQGRRMRECIGTSRRRAQKALDARKGEIVQGRFKLQEVKSSPLLEIFAEEFLEWAKANCRAWESHHASHLKPIQAYFQGKRLHEVTAWLVEKYKAHRLQQATQRPRGPKPHRDNCNPTAVQYVKPATVNNELKVLSSLLSKAVEWGYLAEHPMKGGKVKPLRVAKTVERELTDEEEERLLKASPPWLHDVIAVAVDTGLRQGELVGLSWDRVDLAGREVRLTETKNGRERRVPLTDHAHAVLSRLRRTRAEEDGPFPSGPGKRPWIVASAFRRARTRAGLTAFRFHDLRHTYATRLVRTGADLITVARLLGHQDLRMVLRYAHPGAADARHAVHALEEARARDGHQMDTRSEKGLRLMAVTP